MTLQEVSLPFYEAVLDFLARSPSVREIISYRPPAETQQRFSELLEANRRGELTTREVDELDHYILIERMLSLLKVKAYSHLERGAA